MSPSGTRSQVTPAVSEAVRQAIASYCHALDDGRTDDIVSLFTPGGRAAIPGRGVTEGHAALLDLYRGLTPTTAQRHLVMNTVVTEDEDGSARAISDVVLLLKRDSAWVVSLVGKYDDRLVPGKGDQWLFEERSLTFTT
ncbi:nuclear transport factor 2 family protein, partial [Rhodococcus sp. CX]|uniref:nuclear transport factor 2 family protein n=1 Tax=Rhodococcus sp. CX TaxID=2789880 RepID=UPI0018CCFF38